MQVNDRRSLRHRDVSFTAMGLGCAQMGSLYRWTSYQESLGAFQAAWAAGIRYFDTAPFYGYTRSERRLGTMLTEQEGADYVLSTKVGRLMVADGTVGPESDGFVRPLPFRPVYDYSYDAILRSFEESQHRLGVLQPDILFVHDIGRVTHGDRHAHYWHQLTKGGGFKALGELRSAGRIKAIGLGVNEWQAVWEAMDEFDIDAAMLAGRYTLIEQESLKLLDRAAREGVGIVVAGAFNSGLLAGNRKFNYADAPAALLAQVAEVEAACAAEGVSMQAVALNFPLFHPAVVTVVSGARNAEQIKANIAWMEEDIPHSVWTALKARGVIADGAPIGG
ncbi:aldo/keto reductase [Rhizobium sp. SSA_523]|uniref:aldo/keto reductase n=1 Tax=Rhizobium sp. SSA_523 TaxID=2952477 RepID=UPI002090B207|nr:aldo/keto reductase [Rhizobium sp. SSA_523]MCO5734284.1 aldo/keto reductase [Rhizobium sp. SSA_523]WKC22525.1 aldo/keto reductase [Rhizobium sp. SSA_523]